MPARRNAPQERCGNAGKVFDPVKYEIRREEAALDAAIDAAYEARAEAAIAWLKENDGDREIYR